MIKKNATRHLKVPARASLYYLAASASAKAIGVMATPIFTRLLSSDGYGEYTLYITRLGFLSMMLVSVFAGTHGYRALAKSSGKKDEYISSLTGLSFAFCGVICALLFTFRGFFGLNNEFIIILTVQLLCDAILSVGNMRARFFYSYKQVFFTSFIQSSLSVMISVILIHGAGLGYTARIWGLLISSLIVAVPVFSRMIKKSPLLYSRELWRRTLKRAIPLFPHAVSGALSVQIDRFIISATLGAVMLAKYSVAHSLAAVLSVLTGAVGSALAPWIVRKLKSGEIGTVSDICSSLLLVLSAATVALVAISPEAMRILAPPDYAEAIAAVTPIALSALPSLIYSVGTVVLIEGDGGTVVSLCAMISSFSAIILGFLLVPRLTFVGAGLAHLLSQSIGAAAVLLLLSPDEKRIFSSASVLASLSLALALSFAAQRAEASPILRMFILIFVICYAISKIFRVRGLISEN